MLICLIGSLWYGVVKCSDKWFCGLLGDKVCGDMCPMHDVIREKDMSVCIIVERFQNIPKDFK